ncbi:MAG: hypothetical protein WAK40_02595 [Thermoplasmata archaeon]
MTGPIVEGIANDGARNRAITVPAPSRLIAYLRLHPILCLAILTPGLPEYLSTSSPVLNLVVNPFWFFLGLAINVGQYTAGALLIREAALRWKKGWGTVFVLGLAYGITEEGLGDNTLFNNTHHADAILGQYGHFLGVNWVWAVGVLAFHVIYSIGLPILLLGLALPGTRGHSLLEGRQVPLVFASLAASTALETVLVWGEFRFWMGIPLLIGSLVAIAALTLAGRRAPRELWAPSRERPWLPSWATFAIGFGFFPIAFLFEYGLGPHHLPAALLLVIELATLGLLGELLRRGIGRRRNARLVVDLAFGFVAWQALFGLLLTLVLPYTIPLVVVMVWFFVRLRRAYPADPAPPPAGAMGGAGAEHPLPSGPLAAGPAAPPPLLRHSLGRAMSEESLL